MNADPEEFEQDLKRARTINGIEESVRDRFKALMVLEVNTYLSISLQFFRKSKSSLTKKR